MARGRRPMSRLYGKATADVKKKEPTPISQALPRSHRVPNCERSQLPKLQVAVELLRDLQQVWPSEPWLDRQSHAATRRSDQADLRVGREPQPLGYSDPHAQGRKQSPSAYAGYRRTTLLPQRSREGNRRATKTASLGVSTR